MITERRRFPRTVAKAAVVVHAAGADLKARLVDVAEGGLLAATNVTPPQRWLGRQVEIDLRFDGIGDWLRGAARVVRIVASGLAVAFTTQPAELGRIVDELAGAARARQRQLAVVVIDTNSQRRAAIVAAFRAVGCVIVEAGTPLEGVYRLGESRFEPDVIAVADSQPMEGAEALRRFAEVNHPRVALIRILSGDGPAGHGGWISASDPDDDLPRRVRAVLLKVLGP
jgi:hypothetical protein